MSDFSWGFWIWMGSITVMVINIQWGVFRLVKMIRERQGESGDAGDTAHERDGDLGGL